MGRRTNAVQMTRVRFSCPVTDKQVFDWIQGQSNLSASIRHIIKQYVAEHGYGDATCEPYGFSKQPNSQNIEKSVETVSQKVATQPVAPVQAATSQPIVQPVEQPAAIQQPVQPVASQPIVQPAPVQQTINPQTEQTANSMLADLMS